MVELLRSAELLRGVELLRVAEPTADSPKQSAGFLEQKNQSASAGGWEDLVIALEQHGEELHDAMAVP